MNTDRIEVTHCKVEITYNEDKNRWEFELRGKERWADTLARAKDAITKPPPKDIKPFNTVEVWRRCGYSDAPWSKMKVTSIAKNASWDRSQSFWCVQGGQRFKERAEDLFPINDHNDGLVKQWIENNKQIQDLYKQRESIEKKMKCLKVDNVEPDEE